GLIYFQARYYDPTIGMFITQDPYEGQWDTPMSLHHYLYAYGNPTLYVDRTGYYNETGHYYTTYYVALKVGYSIEEAHRIAYMAQLPDQIGSYDAHSRYEHYL